MLACGCEPATRIIKAEVVFSFCKETRERVGRKLSIGYDGALNQKLNEA